MKRDTDIVVREPSRDFELGAALAALPHPELPGDMDARLRAALEVERRRLRRRRSVATLGLAATLAALVLGGAALAGAFDAGSPAPWPTPPLPAESVYPTNAAGQTYGCDKPLVTEPDLVSVLATNGKQGYCLKSDMDGPTPKSPEDAEEITKRNLRGYTIPVFESDGVTQIGVFQIGGGGGQMRGKQADGTEITVEANADGDIITTTTHPDGTVTIETEALDGTVTTQQLSAAEAKRLKQEEATPKPTATPSRKPDKPQAWLLERMSRLARDAGDAHATAWWELQPRYYFRGVEGDRSPESPYQQWTDVWLVILRGDFAGGHWRYWLLDPDTHNVLSQAQSDRPFNTSSRQIQPLEGPIRLGDE